MKTAMLLGQKKHNNYHMTERTNILRRLCLTFTFDILDAKEQLRINDGNGRRKRLQVCLMFVKAWFESESEL